LFYGKFIAVTASDFLHQNCRNEELKKEKCYCQRVDAAATAAAATVMVQFQFVASTTN
jgi:hypothetical protein